jgi:ATP-dependent helicase HrpB
MLDGDTLAPERFLVVSDLDGKRKDARIRLAAAIDAEDVAGLFTHEVDTRDQLVWEGARLVHRTEDRLGGVVLRSVDRRPDPGPGTAAALAQRLRERNLADVAWSKAARHLQARVAYLHRKLGDPWPDWSDHGLAATVGDWLAGPLATATGLDDLSSAHMRGILMAALGHQQIVALDRLAPIDLQIPSGRRITIDYSVDTPTISVRVQEMFGTTTTPTVAGEPVRLELLSPANRPIQITSDLAGFWRGSWHEVRKEMAGRYPKHEWPEDPATASPSRR